MKITSSLLLLLFVVTCELQAQSKLYVGAEASFIQDLYTITDEGDALGAPKMHGLDIPGTTLLVGYQLNPIFSVETGIATKPVKSGYSLTINGGGRQSGSGGLYFQVPLRSRARVNILGDWLYATGHLGVQFGATDPANIGTTRYGEGSGGMTHNGNEVYSFEARYTSVEKYYTVAEAGAGLDFQISPRFKMYTTVSYVKGFSKLDQVDVTYRATNGPQYSGSVIHEGSYLSFTYGLRYHLKGKKTKTEK